MSAQHFVLNLSVLLILALVVIIKGISGGGTSSVKLVLGGTVKAPYNMYASVIQLQRQSHCAPYDGSRRAALLTQSDVDSHLA